jgi:coenzyme F420-reducing hydrogenase alpha subunit
MNEGRIVSNRGLDIDVTDFEQHFTEEQVPHSNALHCNLRGEGAYMVGPMARYNLNFDCLHPEVQALARETGLGHPCRNPFQSIIIRSIEIMQALSEALNIIQHYDPEGPATLDVQPHGVQGMACTEAPRGILYHYYDIDEKGLIREARIIPPTSQNQKRIEEDLLGFVPGVVDLPDEQISWRCEQMIRNYDPCISCATHFLKLEVERG